MPAYDRHTVADLLASGFSHLEFSCSCDNASQLGFRRMLYDGLVDTGTFYCELVLRVRCKRCGNKPALIEPAAAPLGKSDPEIG